jgi:hypothetical protein
LGIVEQRASPPAYGNSNGHRHARLAELLERHECAALGGLIQADVALAGLFLEARMAMATARCPPQISARDRSATTSRASMSYPVPRSAIGSTGAGDLILANDRLCLPAPAIFNLLDWDSLDGCGESNRICGQFLQVRNLLWSWFKVEPRRGQPPVCTTELTNGFAKLLSTITIPFSFNQKSDASRPDHKKAS